MHAKPLEPRMSATGKPRQPSTALGTRLARLFARELPADDVTRELVEHMDEVQERIEAVRKEVKRGIRSGERRFRL